MNLLIPFRVFCNPETGLQISDIGLRHQKKPDAFQEATAPGTYEAIQVGGDILLLPAPLDRERIKKIEELTKRFIEEHRSTLEALAR